MDEEIAAAIKACAAQAGRSAEAEHRRILEEALRPARASGFFDAARERRIRLPVGTPSTADLLRQDRGRDGTGSGA